MKPFAQFLNEKYIWWMQKVARRRASVSDFALWLDVSQPSLSQWMRGAGREPNLGNLVKLSKLGAREVFHAAGYGELYEAMLKDAFNDPAFMKIAESWFDGTLSDDDRQRIMAIAKKEQDRSNNPGEILTES